MTGRMQFLIAVLCLGVRPLPAQRISQRNALDDFSRTVQQLIDDVSPAVVAVVVQSFGRIDGESSGKTNAVSRQTRQGTAVFVSADGYLITNAHVIQSAQHVQIRVGATGDRAPGGALAADIVGIDQETDLAVLKVA